MKSFRCITRITDPTGPPKDHVWNTFDHYEEAKKWFDKQTLTLRVIGHSVWYDNDCWLEKGTIK